MSQVKIHPVSVTNFIDRLHLAFADGDPEATAKAAEADNVRRLQEQYRALAQGDFGPAFAALADDVEMEFFGPAGSPLVGAWRGRQQVADAIRSGFGLLEEQSTEVLAVIAQGDTVVVNSRETGRIRTTGQPYAWQWVQFFTFRGGQIVRFRGLHVDAA